MKLYKFLTEAIDYAEPDPKPEQDIVDKFADVDAKHRSYYIMKWAEKKGIDSDDAMFMAGYVQDGYIGAGAWNWRYVGMDESVQEVAGDGGAPKLSDKEVEAAKKRVAATLAKRKEVEKNRQKSIKSGHNPKVKQLLHDEGTKIMQQWITNFHKEFPKVPKRRGPSDPLFSPADLVKSVVARGIEKTAEHFNRYGINRNGIDNEKTRANYDRVIVPASQEILLKLLPQIDIDKIKAAYNDPTILDMEEGSSPRADNEVDGAPDYNPARGGYTNNMIGEPDGYYDAEERQEAYDQLQDALAQSNSVEAEYVKDGICPNCAGSSYIDGDYDEEEDSCDGWGNYGCDEGEMEYMNDSVSWKQIMDHDKKQEVKAVSEDEGEKVETDKGNIYTWTEVNKGYSMYGKFTYEGGEFTMYYDPQMRQFDNREPIEGDPKAQQVIDSLPDEYFANYEKETVISGIIDRILENADLQTEELNDLRKRAGIEESVPYSKSTEKDLADKMFKAADERKRKEKDAEHDKKQKVKEDDSGEAMVAKMLAKALGDENRWTDMSAPELHAELESENSYLADMIKYLAKMLYDVKLSERAYKDVGVADVVKDQRGKEFKFDKNTKKFKSQDGEEADVSTKLGKDLMRLRKNHMKRTSPSYPKKHKVMASIEEAYGDAHEITLEDNEDFNDVFGVLGYSLCEVDTFEAEYQGRKVKLNKPMQGDVKKFKVYVKDPKTGNVKKVNFGHGGSSVKGKAMKIRKSNPKARKSFRARHNCDNPGPKTKARYWSCRKW